MKSKKLNDVYMREVLESEIITEKSEDLNAYVTYKKILKTSQKCTTFINGEKKIIVDNGYTILEYTPCDKFYNVRIFIDDMQSILEYYFDIILGYQLLNSEIFYEDLYLDVIYDTKYSTESCDFITLVDEVDLINALKEGHITQEQYDFAYKIAIELMNEIKLNNNKFINRGLKDFKKHFKIG